MNPAGGIPLPGEGPGAGLGERNPCPRCGGEAGIIGPEKAAELAAAIPLDPRFQAGPSVCEARLQRCAACGALREQVLCAYCGCFVRFRARLKASGCPHPAGDKWLEIE